MPSEKSHISKTIKAKAEKLGFTACGLSKAKFLENEAGQFKKWITEGKHSGMQYMENHFEKRMDPRLLHEGTKSVISVLLNYYPEKEISQVNNYKISKYAYGTDYHFVIKEKLQKLVQEIEEQAGRSINARIFVDSAPVLDRAWAIKSGLGWIGKNTCLIRKNEGSFFFIGEILCDLELDYDEAETSNFCGNCIKCLDACPTGALEAPFQLNANKCISYLTIEHKGELPEELKDKFDDWIFGCDICQDVCPHNRFSKPNDIKEFIPKPEFFELKKKDWENMDKGQFKELFKNTPLERSKFEGLKRNIDFMK